ncbi:MAG: hypothetical protein HY810_01230 [Candidatus Omnitrophica bacterium]|nr:hypothetical protein [Candidatus Omnitrophota bacterium]
MKKYISKHFFVRTAIVILLALVISGYFFVKVFFSENKAKIEYLSSSYLNKKISIGSIQYVLPAFIVIKDIRIGEFAEQAEAIPLSIKKITLVFSLEKLFAEKELVISRIGLSEPEFDLVRYPLFLKESIAGFIKLINFLTQGNPLKIELENAAFIAGHRGNKRTTIIANSKIGIGPDDRFSSRGIISVQQAGWNFPVKGHKIFAAFQPGTFRYSVYAAVIPEGVVIEDIAVEKDNLQAKFQGRLENNVLRVTGNVYSDDTPVKTQEWLAQKNKLIRQLYALFKYGKLPQKIGQRDAGVNCTDIDCVLEFASRAVNLKKATFNLNGIPVLVNGDFNFQQGMQLKAVVTTFPEQPFFGAGTDPRKLGLDIFLNGKEGKSTGDITLDFFKMMGKNLSKQKLRADFNNAAFGISPDMRIKLLFDEAVVFYEFDKNEHVFKLRNWELLCNFLDEKLKFVKFNAGIFDGLLKGYIVVDASEPGWKTKQNLTVKDVNASELDALLLSLFGMYRTLPGKFQEKISGKFTCDVNYTGFRSSILNGNLEISQGVLENMQFFLWISGFFNIPSLASVSFDSLSADFLVTDRIARLDNVCLSGKDISLKGQLDVRDNELISGRLALRLSRQILKESSKFQLLLGLISHDIKEFDFNFQFSGLYQSINFQWLESEFKHKVQKMLPGFIEQGLERKVESAIKEISGPLVEK